VVFPLQTFFSSNQADKGLPHRPIITSIPISQTRNPSLIGGTSAKYTRFWNRFRTTSQLYSVVSIIITDIIGDRPTWTDEKGQPLGRNKLLEARRFWRDNRIKETLSAILYDMFITGDGYGWMDLPKMDRILGAAKEATRKWAMQYKENESKYFKMLIKAVQDEDLKKPKKFDYIASLTVQILSDMFEIKGYRQAALGVERLFNVEEVIHFRYKTISGRVEGYCPVESLTKELALMWFVNGNMTAYLENGGKPDNLFILENARPSDDHYERFKEQLGNYKDVRNRHHNMIATSKVDVKQLGASAGDVDMEYQNLALWITSSIAFAYGMPVTRMPFLIGKSAIGGDSGGMAEQGYWNEISERQDQIEDLMNGQLFNRMGWNIKLNRKYKQDEVRDSQVFSMNADTITKMQGIGLTYKKKPTLKKVNEIINWSETDWEKIPEEELQDPFEKTGLTNQNMLDNNSVNKEPDNRKRADTKRNVANNKVNKGLNV